MIFIKTSIIFTKNSSFSILRLSKHSIKSICLTCFMNDDTCDQNILLQPISVCMHALPNHSALNYFS